MRKFTLISLIMLMTAMILTGCGTDYSAKESTVYILKNGRVVSTDVETFDSSVYDEAGLESYVQDAISAYEQEYGSKKVTLKSLTFENGMATLIIEYASAEDYANFNKTELFAGSLAESLAAGYSFNMDFADVTGDVATECPASSFLGGEGYKVVIIKANTDVKVIGDICYLSTETVSLSAKDTASIRPGNSPFGVVPDTQDTEAGPEAVVGTEIEDTEIESASDGSVGEDELLAGEEEETEIVFDFPEEEEETEDDGETETFSTVYTYIIYK